MRTKKLKMLILCLALFAFSCTSKNKPVDEDEFATDAEISDAETELAEADSKVTDVAGGETDEFSDFGNGSPAETETASTEPAAGEADDLDKEFGAGEEPPVAQLETPAPEQPATEPPPPDQAATEPPPPAIEESMTSPEAGTQASQELGQINSVLYQGNNNGGTVVINSTQPLQFTTRLNSTTNQLVVEIQNALIPSKLKRSLNTKDMASSIGSVDIYQKPNSKVARFVIQLRPGAAEPLVQPEGNSLLVVGGANPAVAKKIEAEPADSSAEKPSESAEVANQGQDVSSDVTTEGIMNSQTLEDFMASNNKFYGKKISIEAVKLDVNSAFKFLSEESGVNMIVDEDVSGEVTLKLRQVPWDQAFVLILKTKKLGYKRQGSVIRVASIATLAKEEEDAIRLKEVKITNEPLVVKRFFIGYSDIAELERKIKEFITATTVNSAGQVSQGPSRGRVLSDIRTSSLIVTETPTNMEKITRLISALDTQPQQVLIEGKVVEAQEKFVRAMGVSWSTDTPAPSGNIIQPSFGNISPGIGSSIFNPRIGFGRSGRPGDLGNLSASLSLGEKDDKLRVLSSPRIAVLSNQKATISQTVNVAIEKSSSTSTTTGTITTTTDSVPVGVSLDVTPQVSNEGTVVMDLTIERSFPGSASRSEIEKRNAKTKVIVKSGQTAVIGGIFQADTIDSVSGVPFLKDIPVFGLLFKGQQKSRNKNELVIFVTPRILKPVEGTGSTSTSFE